MYSKISFHMRKNQSSLPKILSQYRKSGSTISSSDPVATRSNCSRLVNTLCLPVCLLCLSDPPKWRRSGAQELGR